MWSAAVLTSWARSRTPRLGAPRVGADVRLDEGGFAVLEVSFGDGLRIVERLVESLVGTTHPHASLVDRVGDRVDIRVVADRERFEVVVARCLHLVDQLRRREARLGKGIELSGCRNRLRRGSGIGLIRTGLYALPIPAAPSPSAPIPGARSGAQSRVFHLRDDLRLSFDYHVTYRLPLCRTICPAVPDGVVMCQY